MSSSPLVSWRRGKHTLAPTMSYPKTRRKLAELSVTTLWNYPREFSCDPIGFAASLGSDPESNQLRNEFLCGVNQVKFAPSVLQTRHDRCCQHLRATSANPSPVSFELGPQRCVCCSEPRCITLGVSVLFYGKDTLISFRKSPHDSALMRAGRPGTDGERGIVLSSIPNVNRDTS